MQADGRYDPNYKGMLGRQDKAESTCDSLLILLVGGTCSMVAYSADYAK